MTFDAQETSTEGGLVLELYEFIFGQEIFRFTSWASDITWQGIDYTAEPISRSTTEATVEDSAGQLTITLPLDNPVPQKFIVSVPGKVGSVRVLRAHQNDPLEQTIQLFEGFVANVSFDGEIEAKILCNPNTKVFNRAAPRFQYMGLCNHILYDARCKVNIGAFTFTGLVSAVSGNDITVNGAGAVGAADHFVGGFCRFPAGTQDDARMILSQAGDVLTLLLPFALNPNGQDIDVFAGCDHTLVTCDAKFAAVLDYGGFPFVPRKNPFNTTLRGGT